jgi:hypothetical protein
MRYTFYFTENIVFVLYKAYSSLPDIKANHLTIPVEIKLKSQSFRRKNNKVSSR